MGYPHTTGLSFDLLRHANIARCETGFGHALSSWSIAEWTNAAAGEMGEACNISKKMIRFRDKVKGNTKDKTREDYRKELALELADTLIYIDLAAASEGIDLTLAIREAFNNKSKEIGSEIMI